MTGKTFLQTLQQHMTFAFLKERGGTPKNHHPAAQICGTITSSKLQQIWFNTMSLLKKNTFWNIAGYPEQWSLQWNFATDSAVNRRLMHRRFDIFRNRTTNFVVQPAESCLYYACHVSRINFRYTRTMRPKEYPLKTVPYDNTIQVCTQEDSQLVKLRL